MFPFGYSLTSGQLGNLGFLGQAPEVWEVFIVDLLGTVKNVASDFWESVMGPFSPMKNFFVFLLLH